MNRIGFGELWVPEQLPFLKRKCLKKLISEPYPYKKYLLPEAVLKIKPPHIQIEVARRHNQLIENIKWAVTTLIAVAATVGAIASLIK